MAGTIDFSNGASWDCSGGVFRDMAQGVLQYLSDNDAAHEVGVRLKEAVESNVLYIHYDEQFDQQMRGEFRLALEKYFHDPATLDVRRSLNPEMHQGHVAMLGKLVQLVRTCE